MKPIVYLLSLNAFTRKEAEEKSDKEIYDLWLRSTDEVVRAYTLQGFQHNCNRLFIKENEWWIRIVA